MKNEIIINMLPAPGQYTPTVYRRMIPLGEDESSVDELPAQRYEKVMTSEPLDYVSAMGRIKSAQIALSVDVRRVCYMGVVVEGEIPNEIVIPTLDRETGLPSALQAAGFELVNETGDPV